MTQTPRTDAQLRFERDEARDRISALSRELVIERDTLDNRDKTVKWQAQRIADLEQTLREVRGLILRKGIWDTEARALVTLIDRTLERLG